MLKEVEYANDMENAFRNREFVVYMQPKVDLKKHTIIGAEALIRWIKPDGSMIFPNEFVPVFEKFIFTTKEDLMERVEKYYDGPDPVGLTHIREGVVVRIDNASKFRAYKHKNFNFKCIEGIAKNDATAPDIEEAQEDLKTEE